VMAGEWVASYEGGDFWPFLYWMSTERECDWSDWVDDLDLNKTQTSLLACKMQDLAVGVRFWWERTKKDNDEPEFSLEVRSRHEGQIMCADLHAMIRDAYDDPDISAIGVIRKFRDMVVERTAQYETRMQEEWPDDYQRAAGTSEGATS
jgi:hypothetical protein